MARTSSASECRKAQGSTPGDARTKGTRPGVARRSRPKASLCIPAYQAEKYLQATIDSVLAQTYPDLEIVIVDNGSSDGTRDIVERIEDDRVRVIRNSAMLPMVDSFNLAVRQCRGEFVKLVCADDILEPDCIARQVAVLESMPGVALVAARTDFIDDDGALLMRSRGLGGIVGRRTGERVVRQMVRSSKNPVGAQVATMFRRADFDRCGGFCGDSVFTMDLDMWVRLLRIGDFYGMPTTLASFRIASDSTTATMAVHSQFAQQAMFTSRLSTDAEWNITTFDRCLSRIRAYDVILKRTMLFKVSKLRAGRRRRRQDGSMEAKHVFKSVAA